MYHDPGLVPHSPLQCAVAQSGWVGLGWLDVSGGMWVAVLADRVAWLARCDREPTTHTHRSGHWHHLGGGGGGLQTWYINIILYTRIYIYILYNIYPYT